MSETREDVFKDAIWATTDALASFGDRVQARQALLDRWEKAVPEKSDGSMVSAARGIEDGPEPEPTPPRPGSTTRAENWERMPSVGEVLDLVSRGRDDPSHTGSPIEFRMDDGSMATIFFRDSPTRPWKSPVVGGRDV